MTIRRSHSLLAAAVLASLMSLTTGAHSQTTGTADNAAVVASKTAELSIFTKLVQDAGLTATLEGSGPVTIFAPSDAAFKAVPAATLDKLGKDPEFLKSLLSYHVVPGLTKSADITGSSSLTTLNGAKVAVSKAGEFVTVDDGLVTKADIVTGNGVIHIIDQVLTPPKK